MKIGDRVKIPGGTTITTFHEVYGHWRVVVKAAGVYGRVFRIFPPLLLTPMGNKTGFEEERVVLSLEPGPESTTLPSRMVALAENQ